MLAPETQKFILDELAREGAVTVSRLSQSLDVTEETIRRDLEKLEKNESLRRTHGGAVPIEGTTYELSLEKRKSINVEAKQIGVSDGYQCVYPEAIDVYLGYFAIEL